MDADDLLPVALHVHVGRAFHPGLVCVRAGGRARHWGFPLMKAWKAWCLWTAASLNLCRIQIHMYNTSQSNIVQTFLFIIKGQQKCWGGVYLSRSLRDPARSPPLLLSLSRSLFLKRCIRSTDKKTHTHTLKKNKFTFECRLLMCKKISLNSFDNSFKHHRSTTEVTMKSSSLIQ